ncbi:MAG: sulfotransferase [Planctomycetota bacterium]
MPRPVFVATAPRSGSTLAVELLGSHERIAMTVEAAWPGFLRRALLLASTPSSRVAEDGEGFTTPGILSERHVRDVRNAFLQTMPTFVQHFRDRVAGDADFFGDKVTSVCDLEFLKDMFPQAAYVHLVRDPRDSLASTYAFEKQQSALWEGTEFEVRLKDLRHLLERGAELLEDCDSLLVRYEDLVTDPDVQVPRVFEFLGLGVSRGVVDYLQGDARRLFEQHGTSATPASSIGRWRRDLDPGQQQAANEWFAPLLQKYGYE